MSLIDQDHFPAEYLVGPARTGLILGTGWSAESVLHEHFQPTDVLSFAAAGIPGRSVDGHAGRFLVGKWQGTPAVVSQGRKHLNEVLEQPAILRYWLGTLFRLMNGGQRLVITQAVGGLIPVMEPGMLAFPGELALSHLVHPYLDAAADEFVNPEDLLPRSLNALQHAARVANLDYFRQSARYFMIAGPAFGGRGDRSDLRERGFHTVGMSLVPELCLTAVENLERAKDGRPPIRVMASQLITDNNDRPSHADNQKVARDLAPRLGIFLSTLLAVEW